MNVLFVLYGDFDSNSVHFLTTHARELSKAGHDCAVAVPADARTEGHVVDPPFRPALYAEALERPESLFRDGRAPDVLQAWTPRESVRRFMGAYLSKRPSPWTIYLEDNEGWIGRAALALTGMREDVLWQHSSDVITQWTQERLPHVLRYGAFIGLADQAIVIQKKLAADVPPWVPVSTVLPGVDLEAFAPRPADPALRMRFGVREGERVIVYPGGVNGFTRPGIEALCRAVGIVNRRGVPCRLLRSGPFALDFLGSLPGEAAAQVTDVGNLPREEVPRLLALADIFVQPGTPDPFEDLRLPGKLPELLAMGRAVVMPDTNIADMLRDGVDAVLHRTGTPEEMAEKCLQLFADPGRARDIGANGRRFAERNFHPATQAARMAEAQRAAIDRFDREATAQLWSDGAQHAEPTALLARRLFALAHSPAHAASAPLLELHARTLESGLERQRGLEIGFEVRDRELTTLRAQVQELGNAGQLLRDALAARERDLANARAELVAASEAGHALRQALAARDLELEAVRASLSWRLTAPLRWLASWLAR